MSPTRNIVINREYYKYSIKKYCKDYDKIMIIKEHSDNEFEKEYINDLTKYIKSLKKKVIYKNNNMLKDFELLCNADLIITSNSTFSFWGSFLSNAKVIAFPLTEYQILPGNIVKKFFTTSFKSSFYKRKHNNKSVVNTGYSKNIIDYFDDKVWNNKSFVNQLVGDNGVYIINLEQDTKKLEFMKTQLDKNNISYTRVNATHGIKEPLEELNKYYNVGNDITKVSNYTFGQAGCATSHIKVWNSLKDKLVNENTWALILEDDALLMGDTNMYLKEAWKILPNDFNENGIVYLQWCYPNNLSKLLHESEYISIIKASGYHGTTAYMINNNGLKRLLNITVPFTNHVDYTILCNTTASQGTYGIKFKNIKSNPFINNLNDEYKKKIINSKKILNDGIISGLSNINLIESNINTDLKSDNNFMDDIINLHKNLHIKQNNSKVFINRLVGDNGVYIINLEKDTKKLEFMKTQLNRNNISYTRVNANYGVKEHLEKLNKYHDIGYVKENISNHKFAEAGCSMSHIKLWHSLKYKLVNENTWALILEDDAFLIGNTNKYLKEAWKILPKDVIQNGIIYLQWCWPHDFGNDLVIENKYVSIMKSKGYHGTTAYMINSKGLNRLLNIKIPLIASLDRSIFTEMSNTHGIYGIKFKNIKSSNIFDSLEKNHKNSIVNMDINLNDGIIYGLSNINLIESSIVSNGNANNNKFMDNLIADKRYICIQTKEGLSNCLRFLFSYYEYAKSINKELIVIWPVTNECPGYYLDYFKPLKNVKFYRSNIKKFKIDHSTDVPHQDFNPKNIFVYNDIKLKPQLKKKIIDIIKKNKYYSAIHVRKTDHIKLIDDLNISGTSYDDFSNFINKTNQKIYLATDNSNTQLFFKNRFKKQVFYNNKIERNTNLRHTSLEDAIIDIYVCIFAQKFKSSYYSSFSELIGQFRKHFKTENLLI
jgi:GR25 family glycosyltransferase involved in LPS biosynthesis